MKYRDILGFSKKQSKKKVVPGQPKPSITDGLKKQFGDTINEGPAYDYGRVTSQIEKSYKKYWDDVKDLQKILDKKGLKKEASLLNKEYSKKVLGFHGWFRGFMDKLL